MSESWWRNKQKCRRMMHGSPTERLECVPILFIKWSNTISGWDIFNWISDWTFTNHFFSDGVVRCLQVVQHFPYDFICIRFVTHRVEQIHRPLSDADITLGLKKTNDNCYERITLSRFFITSSTFFFQEEWEYKKIHSPMSKKDLQVCT